MADFLGTVQRKTYKREGMGAVRNVLLSPWPLMAVSSSSCAFVSLAVLLCCAVGALGRPCKTLLISGIEISQVSDQFHPLPRSIAVYRVIPLKHYLYMSRVFYLSTDGPALLDRPRFHDDFPLAAGLLRERSRDVLVIMVALVFGVGCGALTSAMIYLAWYLSSDRDAICGLQDYDSEEEIESLKK